METSNNQCESIFDKKRENELEEKIRQAYDLKIKHLEHNRILIVDDSPVTDVFAQFFTRVGWIVDVVDDFDSLIRQIKTERYGIIFMDVDLTAADGVPLVQTIRCQKNMNRKTPIVGLNTCI